MKGFPNQVADLAKIAKGMQTLARIVDAGQNAKDDGVLGEAFVRSGVAGTGHHRRPIEEYIADQRTKPRANQSMRTTARGLRELFRALSLIDDSVNPIAVTRTGQEAATFADTPMDAVQIAYWRKVIRNLRVVDAAGNLSHPYQVLLRLIAKKPGIPKQLCALALEAKDDSKEELDRIVAMANLPEDDAYRATGDTRSNWENARKVLPRFAEQLSDVILLGPRNNRSYRIADAPGAGGEEAMLQDSSVAPRTPRSSRAVTADTIAAAGTAVDFDDIAAPTEVDPEVQAKAVAARRDRLRRHNLIVKNLAKRLTESGATLFEDPFDILALVTEYAILGEIKTLDGRLEDERDRVRDALSQLLYYEAFVTRPVAGEVAIRKIACFESQISDEHKDFLNTSQIGTLWVDGEGFAGDTLAVDFVKNLLEEMRG